MKMSSITRKIIVERNLLPVCTVLTREQTMHGYIITRKLNTQRSMRRKGSHRAGVNEQCQKVSEK